MCFQRLLNYTSATHLIEKLQSATVSEDLLLSQVMSFIHTYIVEELMKN